MLALGNNLFIGRTASGEVRLLQLATTPTVAPNVDEVVPDALLDTVITSDLWCTAVATVSRLGAEGGLVYRAQRFHAGI